MGLYARVFNNDFGGVVRCLVDGDDPNVCDTSQPCRRTPLHCAATRGNLQILEMLLHFGADVDAVDFFNMNALKMAIESQPDNLLQVMQTLLLHMSQKDTAKDIFTMDVFDHCVKAKSIKALHLLLDHGYTIQYRNMYMTCGIFGNIEFLQHCISLQGAGIEQHHKDIILFAGCKGRCKAIVKLGLEIGGNLNPVELNPLMASVKEVDVEMVKYLLTFKPTLYASMFSFLYYCIRNCEADDEVSIEPKAENFYTILLLLREYNKAYTLVEKIIECPICYHVTYGFAAQTRCKHDFCISCMKKLQSSTCPLCRQELSVNDQEVSLDEYY